jgi:hypothetical protein
MAKKKAAVRKKTSQRPKAGKTRRAKSVKPRRPAKRQRTAKPQTSRTPEPEYAPSFFLTAQSETAQAYEIDGTPHSKTVQSYRLGNADIREFEEQDGKILYKVKPLQSPGR